ncbi:MAG: hypothetical protein AAB229_00595 [Candidatus Hydrogenedentota bacterium]
MAMGRRRSMSVKTGMILAMAGLMLAGYRMPAGASGDERGFELGNARIFGYGDLHYNSPRGTDFPDRRQADLADAHRFVIGVSYNWTERLSLHAEVDFEHAANAADLEFELGHIDYRHSDALGFRAGVVLMPVGSLNEVHEPTTYYSVERPQIDNFIIPSTWQELGAGFFGTISAPFPIRYRTYAVSNLSAAGFSADQGIRGGRGKLKSQNTSGAAWVGRVEIEPLLGLTLGTSAYYGTASVFGTANGVTNVARLSSVGVNLWTGEVKYIKGPYELQGRYAVLNIGDAVAVSANNTGNDPVAERSTGWLGEAAVHTGQWLFADDSDLDLVLFGRYQEIDTQERVSAGTTKNLAFDRNITTWGLAFFPHRDVALKADVEHWELSTGQSDERYNLGLAFIY